jgi:hypothetical protein
MLNVIELKKSQDVGNDIELISGTPVLTTCQFDMYHEYLIQRGKCRFDLYGWHSTNNGIIPTDVKTINQNQYPPRELSGDIMFDTVYVKAIMNFAHRVDIMITWYRSTPITERLLYTEEWLKKQKSIK